MKPHKSIYKFQLSNDPFLFYNYRYCSWDIIPSPFTINLPSNWLEEGKHLNHFTSPLLLLFLFHMFIILHINGWSSNFSLSFVDFQSPPFVLKWIERLRCCSSHQRKTKELHILILTMLYSPFHFFMVVCLWKPMQLMLWNIVKKWFCVMNRGLPIFHFCVMNIGLPIFHFYFYFIILLQCCWGLSLSVPYLSQNDILYCYNCCWFWISIFIVLYVK